MRKWYPIAILTLPILVFGCWIGSETLTAIPRYEAEHTHPEQQSHDHVHVHSGLLSHGHQHVGFVGDIKHTHPHLHSHHHVEDVGDLGASLTEIGHRHDRDTTTFFWGKAKSNKERVIVSFWTNERDQLVEVSADQSEFNAVLYNGARKVSNLRFFRQGNSSVARLPDGYRSLPNQVLTIEDLELSGHRFHVTIPLDRN